MRATGIVRRMDDLGRIVIPKEIRRSIGIKELDEMEIFIQNNDQIVIRKYVPENIGNVRSIDELGRLVIPMEIRKRLEIKYGGPLEFYIQDKGVILKKYVQYNQCIFCEEQDEFKLTTFKEKHVCYKCIENLAKGDSYENISNKSL